MSTLPTLERRIKIYAGWIGNGIGMKPDFPVDETLTLAVAKEVRDTITWLEKRLAYHHRVLKRITADRRRIRKNGNGKSNGHA